MTELRFHKQAGGARLAFRLSEGSGPTLVFLPGYMSDMEGGKATAVFERARAEGRSALLLDYSGCGQSEGDFARGTLSQWRDDVAALIEAYANPEVMLIGSSMGGWLMLLVAEKLGARVAGMIGVASAPDFSEWGYDESQKAQLSAGETIYEESDYGYEPMPTHPAFWHDAQANRMLDRTISADCPVHLLHGQADPDVPWQTSLKLAAALRSDAVQVTLVKDGDHRLSRDEDIALLLRTVWTVLDGLEITD